MLWQTTTNIKRLAALPTSENGFGLAEFPGFPSRFLLLTPEQLLKNLEGWGKKGRMALDASLFPEIFFAFPMAFFLCLVVSMVLRAGRQRTIWNLVPLLSFVLVVLEDVMLMALLQAWPAKDIKIGVSSAIAVVHGLKIASILATGATILVGLLSGFRGILEELGIQGAKESKKKTVMVAKGGTGAAGTKKKLIEKKSS